jgi:hypothetical protein
MDENEGEHAGSPLQSEGEHAGSPLQSEGEHAGSPLQKDVRFCRGRPACLPFVKLFI